MRCDRVLGMRLAAFVMLAGTLAACDRKPQQFARQAALPTAEAAAMAAPEPPQPATWFQGAPAGGQVLHLAYTHEVGIEVMGGGMAAHFVAARDHCLTTAALHCLLLHAEIGPAPVTYPVVRSTQAGVETQRQVATLRMRLPHDQITAFANALTQPLPGEAAGRVRVVRQATTAEDLGRPIADVAQRMAQLQDYLTSLKALGSRLTISVSDLVKIASETAQAQSQIEAAGAEQRNLALRVDTEELDVDFQEQPTPETVNDPIDQVLADSPLILRDNLADALRAGIAAVPWIPAGVMALILLWILRRLIFGRLARPTGAGERVAVQREPVLTRDGTLD